MISGLPDSPFRISRSAWLLSKGTQKFLINRQNDALYLSGLPIKFNTLPFFFLLRFLSAVSGRGFSAYAVFIISSYYLSNFCSSLLLTEFLPLAMADSFTFFMDRRSSLNRGARSVPDWQ